MKFWSIRGMILNIMMSIVVGAAIFVGWNLGRNLGESPLTNEQVIDLYITNETEISVLWVEMTEQGVDASMRDAVEEWQRMNGE